MTTWRSDVYHLLQISHVQIEVGRKSFRNFSFWNFTVDGIGKRDNSLNEGRRSIILERLKKVTKHSGSNVRAEIWTMHLLQTIQNYHLREPATFHPCISCHSFKPDPSAYVQPSWLWHAYLIGQPTALSGRPVETPRTLDFSAIVILCALYPAIRFAYKNHWSMYTCTYLSPPLTLESLVAVICTIRFNAQNSTFCPHRVFMCCVWLSQ